MVRKKAGRKTAKKMLPKKPKSKPKAGPHGRQPSGKSKQSKVQKLIRLATTGRV